VYVDVTCTTLIRTSLSPASCKSGSYRFHITLLTGIVAFFAASFVRSYPGDWPAFSRAGNFGFSARFYRRPGPAFLV
jgi:hypothetical protein